MIQKTIPILRIFDVEKAKEFYIDWLGFEISFVHQFEPDTPFYIGIKKDNIEFHLSEHHGDSVPGVKVFIVCTQLREYHASLKPYRHYRPSVEKTFYNTWEMTVQDPFGNKLSFNEYVTE
ncbi:glyoxalase superfamily protein [Lacibacter sp. MH-610]|uniref:glyoxalase superfamily protein n=1 Tax=Lacibacter sp. MH-610 TaxID=3020883 RepID=UPI003891D53A